MILLATLTVLLSRAADLILCTDAYRGINPATPSERAFYGGKW
jgi:hypothetical protein